MMYLIEMAIVNLLSRHEIALQIKGIDAESLHKELWSLTYQALEACMFVVFNPDLTDAEKVERMKKLLSLF